MILRRSAARLLLVLAVVTALGGCTTLFFFPSRTEVLTPQKLGLVHEDVNLDPGDGTLLHGWYLPAVGTARGTILHLHGNAQNISTFISAVWWLPARGYNVFLLDYAGYGRSEGAAHVAGVHRDADAGLNYLIGRGGVDRDRLILFGQSLGGSVAIYTAAHSENRRYIRAVISEGAFCGYRAIAKEKMQKLWLTRYLRWPLSFLFNDDYSAGRAAPLLDRIPLLLIHGDRDDVVPYSHSQCLQAAAGPGRELWTVAGGRHTDTLASVENRERFLGYLNRYAGAGGS